jgi:hypothetical protein
MSLTYNPPNISEIVSILIGCNFINQLTILLLYLHTIISAFTTHFSSQTDSITLGITTNDYFNSSIQTD